ncbi:hypothetical protein [Rhodanobacter soli]|uniref:hypothetical protein n=1 Tax=Rhodanobacter soli TaxID=590609 RepID=UPI0031D3BCA7
MKITRKALICLLMLTVIWCSSAAQGMPSGTDQKTLPRPAAASTPQTSQQRIGTDGAPFVVTTLERPQDALERVDAARHRAWEQRNGQFTIWLAALMACVALLQLALFVWQLRLISKSVKDAGAASAAAISAAQAAELNARAAIGIELPVIRAVPPDQLLATSELIGEEEPYSGWVDDGPPSKYSAVSAIEFSNDGRTPAFLTRLSVGWAICKELPASPMYWRSDRLSHAAVIVPGGTFRTGLDYGIELSDDELTATRQDEAWLWFYGALEYSDFLGDKRQARFCWRFANRNPEGRKFYYFASDGDPPEKYTQRS